jgi:hypothetical protein
LNFAVGAFDTVVVPRVSVRVVVVVWVVDVPVGGRRLVGDSGGSSEELVQPAVRRVPPRRARTLRLLRRGIPPPHVAPSYMFSVIIRSNGSPWGKRASCGTVFLSRDERFCSSVLY